MPAMFTGSYAQLAGGAVFTLLLVVGCVTDLRTRKIPNELVLAILVTGWVYALTAGDPWRSLRGSLAGTAVGFGIWIAFYLVGVIGAGDVKFFAAAGAWLGPSATWRAALAAAVVGGVLAVAFLVMERRLGVVLKKIALAASSGSLATVPEQTVVPNAKHQPLPYGVALAIGALIVAWVPGLT
jgi:prepilin peptidase CpaA